MPPRILIAKDPDYDFVSPLGQGGFGSVAKVRRVSDDQIMACKAIDCSSHPDLVKFAGREIDTWSSFAASEKYIANFSHDVAWSEKTQTMRLYMKFYDGGDMQRVIDICRHEDMPVHPFMAMYWALEVVRGVKACHDHGIIHRDLKPANVLLAMPYVYNSMLWAVSEGEKLSDEQKVYANEFLDWLDDRPAWCHLTDFGLGKFSPAAINPACNTVASFGMMGTPGFMAPEILGDDPKFSVKSDVYSLGCLVYALCSGRPPPSLSGNILSTRVPEIPPEFPKRMRNIISRCMQFDLERRPNSREALNEISEAYIDFTEDEKFGRMRSLLKKALRELNGEMDTVMTTLQELNLSKGKNQGQLDDLLIGALLREDLRDMERFINEGANVNIKVFDDHGENDYLKQHDLKAIRNIERAKRSQKECTSNRIPFDLVRLAIVEKLWDGLELLLENGARYQKEFNYFSPVGYAAGDNNPDLISRLVNKWGFDITANAKNAATGEEAGMTALGFAATFAAPKALERLLELGADPRRIDSRGKNVYHYMSDNLKAAAVNAKGVRECGQILMKYAPDVVNVPDKEGNTPLHCAVRQSLHNGMQSIGSVVILTLRVAGADACMKNKNGVDAFYIMLNHSDCGPDDNPLIPAKDYPILRATLLCHIERNRPPTPPDSDDLL
ncbi:Phytochrome [Arthrobotrys entomopaga]|nr:Phytochrome [Arthrobotrys entomopaga]